MKKMIAFVLVLVCALCLGGCDTAKTDALVCSRIDLCYHGNKDTSIMIEDDTVCQELMAFIAKADGTREGSSKGYYGVPYTLTIFFEESQESLAFYLWSDTRYSTSEQTDAEGYPYLFKDDLSDLYQYLEENYPDEFWYDDINPDK